MRRERLPGADLALSGPARHHGGVTIFDRRPVLRWVAPAVAVALIVGGTLVGSVAASADAGLPAKSASELLVDLQGAQPVAMSGTIESRADLGLPELPAMAPTGSDLTSLVSGTHTLRVWTDGATRSRLALVGPQQETDVYRDGRDMWLWSSSDQTAEHIVAPQSEGMPDLPSDLPAGVTLPSTPAEAANQALAAIDPSTTVTTTGVAKVAGRAVYELVLTPKQDATLVAKIAIAIDAETSTPLRVQVYSRQLQDPAFEIGFTSVDFGPVDDGIFAFTPSPGATVTDHAVPSGEPVAGAAMPDLDTPPAVVGTGWESVIVAKMPAPTGADAAGASDAPASDSAGSLTGMLDLLPVTTGPWGSGRVLAGTLFSVILTDDGRVAIGALSPDAVGAALAAA